MFGRRQTTAMEYKPEPVNYTPVTRAADLIEGDLVTYNDGHSIVTAVVIAITEDCRPVLQKGEYGVRRGADAFDLFMPRIGVSVTETSTIIRFMECEGTGHIALPLADGERLASCLHDMADGCWRAHCGYVPEAAK